jgi:hypothetical protein
MSPQQFECCAALVLLYRDLDFWYYGFSCPVCVNLPKLIAHNILFHNKLPTGPGSCGISSYTAAKAT